MDIVGSLRGMVKVEVTSGDVPSLLMALAREGIFMESLEYCQDLTASICIPRNQYRKMKSICEKRGDNIHITRRNGLYWKGKALLNRPVLCAGIVFLLLGSFYLPTKVLFFRVEGNEHISEQRILEAADACGIHFGASRREVRSERVKNALLQELPELQWAGINTYGCVGIISVRERRSPSEMRGKDGFGHIVALRDGIVSSCTATRGNLLCQPGQAVAKGQVLISGYTDCGIVIQATGAAGEVYATTNRKMEAVMPAEYTYFEENRKEENRYSLLVGKKRINLWKDSGIWGSSCGRIYEENYITLPGDFQLPFGWATDTWISATVSPQQLPDIDAEQMLRAFVYGYLRQRMIAGSIEAEDVQIAMDGDLYRLKGEYVCTEMIGAWQAEEIGETNGKSD